MQNYYELQRQGLSGYHIGRLLLTELYKDAENNAKTSGQPKEPETIKTEKR